MLQFLLCRVRWLGTVDVTIPSSRNSFLGSCCRAWLSLSTSKRDGSLGAALVCVRVEMQCKRAWPCVWSGGAECTRKVDTIAGAQTLGHENLCCFDSCEAFALTSLITSLENFTLFSSLCVARSGTLPKTCAPTRGPWCCPRGSSGAETASSRLPARCTRTTSTSRGVCAVHVGYLYRCAAFSRWHDISQSSYAKQCMAESTLVFEIGGGGGSGKTHPAAARF